jgi:hypothetical protein
MFMEFDLPADSSIEIPQEVSEDSAPLPQESSQPQPQTFKVKVDGVEKELTADELVRDYQLREASQKRFQQAAEMSKQAQAQMEALQFARENPIEFFRATGVNAKEFAEKVLLQELEESMLSPEERELRDLRNYKNKIDQEQKSQLAIKQEQQRLALEEQTAQEIENEILEVLTTSNLKPTPRNIAKCAEYLLASLDEKGNRMHARDAFQRVQTNTRKEVAEHIADLTPEEMEQQFPEFYKKLLAHSANKGKVSLPVPFNKTAQSEQKTKQQSYSSFWNDVIKGK